MSVILNDGGHIVVDLHTENSVAAIREIAQFESRVAEAADANPSLRIGTANRGRGGETVRAGDVRRIDLAEIRDRPARPPR
jgi:hypothetical protein